MSDVFKGFAWTSIFFGVICLLISFVLYDNVTMAYGIIGISLSIFLFILSGFCKIMEDTRDTLKRIETLLQNQKEE